ncbi:MAG: hypothetical protein GY754_03860 [bacterium]|nr:hypothetical protein [bacterium]
MTPEEILELSDNDKRVLWMTAIEKVGVVFLDQECYGACIHRGFSYYFGATDLMDYSDLILVVNNAIAPFNDDDPLCRPKNENWETFFNSEDEGAEKEKAYLNAHNRDLDALVDTPLAAELILQERAAGRYENKVALAFYEGLIGAAYTAEKRLNNGKEVHEAYQAALRHFFKAFVKYEVTPFPPGSVRVFADATKISLSEALIHKIAPEEICGIRAIQTLSKCLPIITDRDVEAKLWDLLKDIL